MEILPKEISSNIFQYVPKDKDLSSPTADIFKQGYITEIEKLDHKENRLWEQVYENRGDVNSITFETMLSQYQNLTYDKTIKSKSYRKYYIKMSRWLYKKVYDDSDDEP